MRCLWGAASSGRCDGNHCLRGHNLSYEQPGWYCDGCDEGVLESDDNAVHDAALHEVMAWAKGSPISPLAVRAARESAGLSQREAGRVFGGGPTAFYKYETAKAVPSESMANLLRLALKRPELFRSASLSETAKMPSTDIALARRVGHDTKLAGLLRRVYPK